MADEVTTPTTRKSSMSEVHLRRRKVKKYETKKSTIMIKMDQRVNVLLQMRTALGKLAELKKLVKQLAGTLWLQDIKRLFFVSDGLAK